MKPTVSTTDCQKQRKLPLERVLRQLVFALGAQQMKPGNTIISNVIINGFCTVENFFPNFYKRSPVAPGVRPARLIFSVATRKPLRKFTWLLFLFINLTDIGYGQTAIAVVRTDWEVVLAADSMAVHPETFAVLPSVCKINQINSLWFTASGHTRSAQDGLVVDARRVIAEFASKPGTFRERVNAFAASYESQVGQLLVRIRQKRKDYYRTKIVNKVFLNAIFAGIENGNPVFFIRDFNGPPTFESEPKLSTVETNADARSTGALNYQCRGQCVEAMLLLDKYKERGIFQLAPADTAHFAVAYSALEHPDHVGAPIDIVRITKDGAKWIQQKDECKTKVEHKKPFRKR